MQIFKPVYFHDRKEVKPRAKGFNIVFGKQDRTLYKKIAQLDSGQIRQLLGTDSYGELEERAMRENLPVNRYCLWYLEKNLASTAPLPSSTFTKPISHFLDKVIEADCLEEMQKIPPESIDLILCDLPYGTTQNNWDSVISLDKLWIQYERIIKDAGVIALTGQGLFSANLMLSNPRLFKYKLAWVKSKPTNFLNAKKQPLRKHEDILIFYKNQPKYIPQMTPGLPYNKGFRKDQLTGSYGDFKTVEVKSNGDRYPTDVVYFKTAESEGDVYHPTQKPIELGRYIIRTFTSPGDVVLDNTCGSGSFLVSAVLENRRFIGIEKNQEMYLHKKTKIDYIDVCRKRIAEARKALGSQTGKLDFGR